MLEYLQGVSGDCKRGTASADPNVSAVIGAALATGDEATINAAVAPLCGKYMQEQILNRAPVGSCRIKNR